MKVGIMQPYFMPYIGYFQLINAVDKFVICDDFQYIKSGWINRNRIIINGQDKMITICAKQDNYKTLINQKSLVNNFIYQNSKVLKAIELSYRKAPYFYEVIQTISKILNYNEQNLCDFITYSLSEVCDYLGIETEILLSSQLPKDSTLASQSRIINMCKVLNADVYINAIGGMKLYSKQAFKKEDIDLYFIKTRNIVYKQFDDVDFIPNLSIIDVLMFNPKEKIRDFLDEYDLIQNEE